MEFRNKTCQQARSYKFKVDAFAPYEVAKVSVVPNILFGIPFNIKITLVV